MKQGQVGLSRRNPSRGCETLWTERTGRGKPGRVFRAIEAAVDSTRWTVLKEPRTSGEASRGMPNNHARPPTTVIL